MLVTKREIHPSTCQMKWNCVFTRETGSYPNSVNWYTGSRLIIIRVQTLLGALCRVRSQGILNYVVAYEQLLTSIWERCNCFCQRKDYTEPLPKWSSTTSVMWHCEYEVTRGHILETSDITPCSPLSVNRRFGGTYRRNLQGRKISRARYQRESSCSTYLWTLRWRWNVPLKRRLNLNGLHGVISQKMVLFITTALRSSNLQISCCRRSWHCVRISDVHLEPSGATLVV
jgi:hypothetical protein